MKKISITILIIFAVVLGTYAWLGGFTRVAVSDVKAGPFHLLYLDHKGPYKNIGNVIHTVDSLIDANAIKPVAYFGIYYDKPDNLDESKLRSGAGIIVDDAGLTAAKGLLKEGKLKTRTIAEQNYARAEFPFRNMMSMFIAIQKVFPALNQYGKEHNFPEYQYKEKDFENDFIMEIYREDTIEYLMTLPAKK